MASGSMLRLRPHNIHAEMAVLGSMMLNEWAGRLALSLIKPGHFYKQANRDIYSAIATIYERNAQPDLVLMRDGLVKAGALEKVGGVAYLAQVLDSVPTSANAEHYTRIVLEYYARRSICELGQVAERAQEEGEDIHEVLTELEKRVAEIWAVARIDLRALPETILAVQADIERRIRHETVGLQTGIGPLDRATGGIEAGSMVVIGARTSVGKTSLALNIVKHVGVDQGKRVGMVSLEVPRKQVVTNLLCIIGQVRTEEPRRGLSQKGLVSWNLAREKLAKAPIWIEDRGIITVEEVTNLIIHEHGRQAFTAVVIDYVQLLGCLSSVGKRNLQVDEISKRLKALGAQLEMPVFVLSQLSRRKEMDGRIREPRLSDLTWSSALEQDADMVLLLYRPDLVGAKQWSVEEAEQGRRVLELAKNRNGPTGHYELLFDKPVLTFREAEDGSRWERRQEPGRGGQDDSRSGGKALPAGAAVGGGEQGTQEKSRQVGDDFYDGAADVPDEEIPF